MNDTDGTTRGSNDPRERHANPPTEAPGDTSDGQRQSLSANWLGSGADRLGPQLVLAAQDQGHTAALNGDHVDTCPWLTATTELDLALRQMWVRGYSAGRTDLSIARDRRPR